MQVVIWRKWAPSPGSSAMCVILQFPQTRWIFELAVEGGADDITNDGESIEIFGPVDAFKELSDMIKEEGIELDEAGLRYLPKQELSLETEETLKVLHVLEELEDLDDVEEVFSNLDISEEALKALEAA